MYQPADAETSALRWVRDTEAFLRSHFPRTPHSPRAITVRALDAAVEAGAPIEELVALNRVWYSLTGESYLTTEGVVA